MPVSYTHLTGISLMKVIPPVRNKVNTTDLIGPSSQAFWADGEYGGGITCLLYTSIGNTEKALTYLNAIVTRANPAKSVTSADLSLERILKERRQELVGEGHAFFDYMLSLIHICDNLFERICRSGS